MFRLSVLFGLSTPSFSALRSATQNKPLSPLKYFLPLPFFTLLSGGLPSGLSSPFSNLSHGHAPTALLFFPSFPVSMQCYAKIFRSSLPICFRSYFSFPPSIPDSSNSQLSGQCHPCCERLQPFLPFVRNFCLRWLRTQL